MLLFTLTVNALLATVLDGNDIEDENTRSDMIVLVFGALGCLHVSDHLCPLE